MIAVAASVFVASVILTAQDKSTVKVPDGLALSAVKGYEGWQVIAPSETDKGTKAILGNEIMMKAFADGIPVNGKTVPDGAMMAKIEWTKKSDTESPYAVTVPDSLKSLSFMVKDAKRYADTGGWAWAQFTYDAASNRFKPEGTGVACGYACHTKVKARDYVFTHYAKR
jgi:hypothetical protein